METAISELVSLCKRSVTGLRLLHDEVRLVSVVVVGQASSSRSAKGGCKVLGHILRVGTNSEPSSSGAAATLPPKSPSAKDGLEGHVRSDSLPWSCCDRPSCK